MSYHAQLSAHLANLLSTHIENLASRPGNAGNGMVTDMQALRERDREHATAWMTEGYARYVGGAGGFELKVVPGASGASELDGRGSAGGRKRRYTEEPGLLVRRGMGGMLSGSAVGSEEGREGKRRRCDDRGRDIISVGSARRTVSAGPTTPETVALPSVDPTIAAAAADDNTSRRATTPPLAYVPLPNQVVGIGRAFTLQQPPAPRRPFRRPLQPRTVTAADEEGNQSTGSIVLASQHLVHKVDQSMEDLKRGVMEAAAAIGTSSSASSALSALAHTLVPLPQAATTGGAVPCAASPSVGSLTSASLGCARATLLTPLPNTGTDRQTVSPIARPVPRDLGMAEESQSARIRRREEDEIWDCFMQLGEGTPGEGT